MKYFIITIDTEGDNLWEYRSGDNITTDNSRYIPRFQSLCEKYGYKPVYLVNYEMAADAYFCEFASSALHSNNCEIGIHLHAWNNPPPYEFEQLSNCHGSPYLIEYPLPVMRQKFDFLYNFLSKQFQCKPISHRAGRWAMNQHYFDILIDYGIQVDCSVTPHISWKSARGYSSGGTDYSRSSEEPFPVKHSCGDGIIVEMPVTVRKIRLFKPIMRKYLVTARNALLGKKVWLRPNGNNLSEMLELISFIEKSNSDYLMFMLHSSELMPGGSPSFTTGESIEKLYDDIEILFTAIAKNFTGITLKDYYVTRTQP